MNLCFLFSLIDDKKRIEFINFVKNHLYSPFEENIISVFLEKYLNVFFIPFYKMRFVILIIILCIFLTGCKLVESEKDSEGIVCNSPYMRHAAECCLDVDNNSICDSDEVVIEDNTTIKDNSTVENNTEENTTVDNQALIDQLINESNITVINESQEIPENLIPAAEGENCTADDDCEEDLFCIGDVCSVLRDGCDEDEDCDDDYECVDGFCEEE